MTAPALELRGLGKAYGATTVLRGVDLAVRAGERVAIIGPNGAGKSTLFNLVSGRSAPSSGTVWLQGRRIDGLRPFEVQRRGLARSFQTAHGFARLSVYYNLSCAVLGSPEHHGNLLRRLQGLRAVHARTEALLRLLRLEARAELPAAALSYAEQRALEIGITVASGAQVLLLDEPTAGMSQSESRQCVQLIHEVSEGRTLLMVEHDMGVVFGLASRIAVLVRGELIAFDTPQAVRANPRVQEAYLGAMPPALAGQART